MARFALAFLAISASVQTLLGHAVDPPGTAYLVSRAVLPSPTFASGPASGAAVANGTNGIPSPFPGQPVQGISGVLPVPRKKNTYYGMCDNGYGAKGNSADFLLRIYELTPTIQTPLNSQVCGGPGLDPTPVALGPYIQLADPNNVAGFTIVNDGTEHRNLTGADFDVESIQRAADGTFFIGDEFGPFVLHFSATGVLLSAPVPNGDLKSLSSPFLAVGETALVSNSRGYEGMAMSPNRKFLYPALEGQLRNETENKLRRFIYEFSVASNTYTGRRWSYATAEHPVASQDVFIADMQSVDANRLMVLERDNGDGNPGKIANLAIKRIYMVDLRVTDAAGYLVKTLVADLLDIRDGAQISNDGTGGFGLATWTNPQFKMALTSVECILPMGRDKVMVVQDTNMPFDSGRIPGKPDGTEMVVIRVQKFR